MLKQIRAWWREQRQEHKESAEFKRSIQAQYARSLEPPTPRPVQVPNDCSTVVYAARKLQWTAIWTINDLARELKCDHDHAWIHLERWMLRGMVEVPERNHYRFADDWHVTPWDRVYIGENIYARKHLRDLWTTQDVAHTLEISRNKAEDKIAEWLFDQKILETEDGYTWKR